MIIDLDLLFRSLDNAVANGYVEDFDGTGRTIYDVDPLVLATDTCDCDANFEDHDAADLVPLIREWQAARRPA